MQMKESLGIASYLDLTWTHSTENNPTAPTQRGLDFKYSLCQDRRLCSHNLFWGNRDEAHITKPLLPRRVHHVTGYKGREGHKHIYCLGWLRGEYVNWLGGGGSTPYPHNMGVVASWPKKTLNADLFVMNKLISWHAPDVQGGQWSGQTTRIGGIKRVRRQSLLWPQNTGGNELRIRMNS